jgi:sortase A
MFKKKIMMCLIVVLVLTGYGMVAHSGYFYAKGLVAQVLLNQAWEKSKRGKKIVKAWSWADTYPIGKLSIRSIDLSRVVLKDARNKSLSFGPAHISVSSRPGSNGNIAIAGHRDSFFKNLRFVERGEVIELESMSSVQYFIVTDIQITDPENTRWAENTQDNVITLITCYPFDYDGPAPKRYVVRGKLIKKRETGEMIS